MTISLTQPDIGSNDWGDDVNTNFETIATAINTGGAGGPPTATSWGANTETLSADKTLVDGDDTIQHLDPGAASRVVNLPTPTTSSKLFLITNNGNAAFTLTVRKGFTVLATLATAQTAWCICDGLAWTVVPLPTGDRDYGYHVFGFGGQADTTTTRRLNVHGHYANSATTTTDGVTTAVEMPADTLVDAVSQVVSSNGNQTWQITKNGAASESLTSSSFSGTPLTKNHNTSSGFLKGDTLSFVMSATTSALNSQKVLAYGRGEGMVLGYGGTPTAGNYYQPHGVPATAGATLTALDAEHYLAYAGADLTLAWTTTAGNATTQVIIWKNGASSDPIVLSGVQGNIATAGTSYAATDQIAIEYDSGTAPGASIFYLSLDTTGLMPITWAGANVGGFGVNKFALAENLYTDAVLTTENAGSTVCIPWACTATLDAFQTSGWDAADTQQLWKNGASSQAITTTANEEIVALSTSYAAGDDATVRSTNNGNNTQRHRIHFVVT